MGAVMLQKDNALPNQTLLLNTTVLNVGSV